MQPVCLNAFYSILRDSPVPPWRWSLKSPTFVLSYIYATFRHLPNACRPFGSRMCSGMALCTLLVQGWKHSQTLKRIIPRDHPTLASIYYTERSQADHCYSLYHLKYGLFPSVSTNMASDGTCRSKNFFGVRSLKHKDYNSVSYLNSPRLA
jgi:hypothetical protein